jgi:hypothetical protein
MYAGAQLLGQDPVHQLVARHGELVREGARDDDDLEVGLRATWNAVLIALVVHGQLGGDEGRTKLVLDSFRDGHPDFVATCARFVEDGGSSSRQGCRSHLQRRPSKGPSP